MRELAGGLAWSVGAVAAERLIAVAQAFYVARLLGIEDFGKYGLVFLTVGLMSSLIGLQLGLTAAVNIARLRTTDAPRAAAVMRLCEFVSLGLAGVSFALVFLAPAAAAKLLLGDPGGADVVVAAGAIAALSVLAGVEEGVLQGLEQFRGLALLRTGMAMTALIFLVLLARGGDLNSVIYALTAATALRTLAFVAVKETTARRLGLKTTAHLLRASWGVLISFSLPAMLGSLLSGSVNWLGVYFVSQAENGFREVAVLTAGQQWRGLALYLASIAAGVAIPIMSRLSGAGDTTSVRQIHAANLAASAGGAILFVAALGIASGTVLNLYGPEFVSGRLAFLDDGSHNGAGGMDECLSAIPSQHWTDVAAIGVLPLAVAGAGRWVFAARRAAWGTRLRSLDRFRRTCGMPAPDFVHPRRWRKAAQFDRRLTVRIQGYVWHSRHYRSRR